MTWGLEEDDSAACRRSLMGVDAMKTQNGRHSAEFAAWANPNLANALFRKYHRTANHEARNEPSNRGVSKPSEKADAITAQAVIRRIFLAVFENSFGMKGPRPCLHRVLKLDVVSG